MILPWPGWVIFGALMQAIGLLLAVYIIASGVRRRRHREPAGAPVPGDLLRRHAAASASMILVVDQPGEDQRDERLLRLADLDELVHPDHRALALAAWNAGAGVAVMTTVPAKRSGAERGFTMKVRNSLRSLKSKPGSVVTRRRGRMVVINRKNPRWNGRQG
jgi:large subunit ribosomal protein L36